MKSALLDRRPGRTAPAGSAPAAGRRSPGPGGTALAVTVLFAVVYALLAVTRHRRMLSAAFDLGIFEQAVRAYAEGRAPVVELKGPGYNLLGDHFHPVLTLLAPLYRLAPGPVTLLLAQSCLMALACLPITRWACRDLGVRAGLLIGLAFGSSWGMVAAAGFDFHEIAFAVPLLAFCTEALAARRWRAAVLWALPLVLVKEDLGLTVGAVGGYLLWRGDRRAVRCCGLALLVLGPVATAVETLVLLPLANPHGVFDYWNQVPGVTGASGASTLCPLWPPMKWLLLFMLAAPVAFVGVRSPLLLLCVPTLAWRLLGANESYWQPYYHYSAVLMPVLFGALVDRLGRRQREGREGWRPGGRWRRLALAWVAAFAAVCAVVYPLRDLALPGGWTPNAHVRTAHRLLAQVPDGATVASSNRLSPLLVSRTTVSLVCQGGPGSGRLPEWVVADRTDPTVTSPCPEARTLERLAAYRAAGYLTVAEEDGIIVLRRP
ncbi:DUF2079 domain-containing protein [Kitasatospora sp. NPDC096147]|uniref:DUF2079 domain-containing protein n=1 Tax=Kitasatospora sp. NPDC096147 TaxID=3364093 RepID=UPI00382BD0B9